MLEQVTRLLQSRLPASATVGVSGLGDVLSWDDARDLCAAASAVPVDASDLLAGLAATPGPEDLDLYRAAARVAERGLREFRRLVEPGASVASVCARVEASVRALGGRHPIVLLGRGPFFQRLADPEETVADGDLLSAYVETGGAGGVWIEEVRLLAVGELSASARRLHDAATEVLTGAIALLRTDADAASVVRHVAGVADRAGVRMASTGVVGHGVGLGDRGFGRLDLTTSATLPRGCPLALHPTLLTADRTAGATVGGTYLVTNDGGHPLAERPDPPAGVRAVPDARALRRNGVSTCA
jgi:Xaa-Pro aminopeptidase